MGKAQVSDEKRVKILCPKCGLPCGNEGSFAMHTDSKTCRRRQKADKLAKEKENYAEPEADAQATAEPEPAAAPAIPPDRPEAAEDLASPSALPPAPASDSPAIPDEKAELQDFTRDLDLNLRERERTRPNPELEIAEPGDAYNIDGDEDQTRPAPKRRIAVWLLAGAILAAGLAYAAHALISKRRRADVVEVQARAVSSKTEDPDLPVDPWTGRP